VGIANFSGLQTGYRPEGCGGGGGNFALKKAETVRNLGGASITY